MGRSWDIIAHPYIEGAHANSGIVSTMAKSKRINPPRALPPAKKQREGDPPAAPSAFDSLCDNTLLRILSYSDDLRSLIYLTRCTSKSLRERFDPRRTGGNALDESNRCSKIWEEVFDDLGIIEMASGDSSGYLASINYVMSLYKTLIGEDKRSKAGGKGTKQNHPLPLRQHHFKTLPVGWRLDSLLPYPFALLSDGFDNGFVCIDPKTLSLGVYTDVLDNTTCLDKSVQKRLGSKSLVEVANEPHLCAAQPAQQLMATYTSFPVQYTNNDAGWRDYFTTGTLWNGYFGRGTPFDGLEDDSSLKMGVEEAVVYSFVEPKTDGMRMRNICLERIMVDLEVEHHVCTEFLVWRDKKDTSLAYKERDSGSRAAAFSLRTFMRLPGR